MNRELSVPDRASEFRVKERLTFPKTGKLRLGKAALPADSV